MIADLVRRLPRPLRAPLRVAGVHTGRHRGERAIPVGALVSSLFVDCRVCGVETPGTVHGQGIRCSAGHFIRRADQ